MTSTRGPGNFSSWVETDQDGHAGADEICRVRAAAVALPNADKFKAWLSTEVLDLSAIDHLTYDGPWVLPNGVKVADSKADLTDGSIFTGITIDEPGVN